MTREDLTAKIEWEGGLFDALDYGIRTDDMPEGDVELREAWAALETAYASFDKAAQHVDALLGIES